MYQEQRCLAVKLSKSSENGMKQNKGWESLFLVQTIASTWRLLVFGKLACL